MKTDSFLWEIGCEEIPADWLPGTVEELSAKLGAELRAKNLEGFELEAFGTARRLVAYVKKLPEKQNDRSEIVTGPPLRIARDGDGKWTKPALGFAQKNDVALDDLAVLETPKGEYVGFERQIKGRKTRELLPEIMSRTLRGISFPKFMSWDAALPDGQKFPFGRPIRWIVALFAGKVIPFQVEVLGSPPVKSGRKTRGHRFLAPKGKRAGAPFAVSSFRDLKQGLKKHYVLLDSGARRERLLKELEKAEKKIKGKRASGLSESLVADLVEWPGVVAGSYPKQLMALPEEVRHTVLIHHQHYFPIKGKPSFLAVTNMPSDPKGHIRRGSERVVVARLRDARFFWDDDLKRPLADRRAALDGVLFQESIGSYRAKTERVVELASSIARQCDVEEASVRRAAELAKCDLVTGMVGEFPELQGIMGGLYAKEQGEPEAVWKAVYSHYRPQGLDDEEELPTNPEGVVLALADKLDTLAAMFSVGLTPTGSRDPFGLRRAALGVLRLLAPAGARKESSGGSLSVSIAPRALLKDALRIAAERLDQVRPEAEANLVEFVTERLRFVLSKSYRYDEVNAVFAMGALERPVSDVRSRLEAVASMRGSGDFEALSVAFKRVQNILAGQTASDVDVAAFVEDGERRLFSELEAVEPEAQSRIESGDYRGALSRLSELRGAVDRFFDDVLVMAEQPRLRSNRLALLFRLRELFTNVADLSEIVPGEGEGKRSG